MTKDEFDKRLHDASLKFYRELEKLYLKLKEKQEEKKRQKEGESYSVN